MSLRFESVHDLPQNLRSQVVDKSLGQTAAGMQEKIPTESEEQQDLISWADDRTVNYPVLEYLFHIPNGGGRSKAEAGRFKAEGVKAGVPDLCLPHPKGGFHGLYIEMKRAERGSTGEDQKRWIAFLKSQGYCVRVCKGSEAAKAVLLDYLEGRIMFSAPKAEPAGPADQEQGTDAAGPCPRGGAVRKCTVKGRNEDRPAWFHRWTDFAAVLEPSAMVGGHPGGQIRYTRALVEYPDGSVEEVAPERVQFKGVKEDAC